MQEVLRAGLGFHDPHYSAKFKAVFQLGRSTMRSRGVLSVGSYGTISFTTWPVGAIGDFQPEDRYHSGPRLVASSCTKCRL